MPLLRTDYDVIVIGGGHAGVEAAWAAANALSGSGRAAPVRVALVTQDPTKVGVMSCNPANGGLAKGQIVREIDALGGLMGLATDAAGIQFRVLNTSKGAAVLGPRAQCDKHAYARVAQGMIASRTDITVIGGTVEKLVVEGGAVKGVVIAPGKLADRRSQVADQEAASPSSFATCHLPFAVSSSAIVLTTGTFMRALMHTGEQRTEGGRVGEGTAVGISHALRELGFELGRLKTGTPPRLKRSTIDWNNLEQQRGDDPPQPFSELSALGVTQATNGEVPATPADPRLPFPSLSVFPVLPQVDCRLTQTTPAVHDTIRANLHRAPMYSGQIESTGPRYCPSIEDKVVRFADRKSHGVYLEPESLEDDWVYCNGISTSLPADVQDVIVRSMPGCERAEILRYGYAVEYDMVRPHQIGATTQTKLVRGLFLAGQINGTSGYEEAAAQGLVAGLNAARHALGEDLVTLGRHQAYIGVLLDDLATKTPVEPYRMFTSRAEHRLLLRADNAPDRLTPIAEDLGLLRGHDLGRLRSARFADRKKQMAALNEVIDRTRIDFRPLADVLRNPEFTLDNLRAAISPPGATDSRSGESVRCASIAEGPPSDRPRNIESPLQPAANAPTSQSRGRWHPGRNPLGYDASILFTVHTDRFYEPYERKARADIARTGDLERRRIPADLDYTSLENLRAESRAALLRFKPETLGQASRLEGLTPADIVLLSMLIKKHRDRQQGATV
ncbi:MAG: FAD-dependent oxidoreductase [Phycisphaerales bacterium]|nr:FAD-dependent oxidoreductase [Phycisphaerales bacterium]